MFGNQLPPFLRRLKRNALDSSINIAGLGLGIACVIAIALFVYDELRVDRFHRNYHSIVRVVQRQQQADATYNVAGTPGPLASALKQEFPDIINTMRIGQRKGILTYKETSIVADGMIVADPSFFDVFSFHLLFGRPGSLRTPDQILLTERTAANLFGSRAVNKDLLGKVIQVDKSRSLTIAGIVQDPPVNSSLSFDAILPFILEERMHTQASRWNSNNYFTYLQLKPAASAPLLESKIHLYLKKHLPETKAVLLLQPLKKIYLQSKFDFNTDWGRRSNLLYVQLFTIVGLVVLVIAIANFINLTTARSMKRAREVGVRKVAGAGRNDLVRQFLIESILLTLISVIVAIVFVQLSLPHLNEVSGKQLFLPYFQVYFWIFLLGFAIVLGTIAGIVPAYHLTSFRPVHVLKGAFHTPSGIRLRQTLVVGQFAMSILLASTTFVVYRQLHFIQAKNLGYDKSHLLHIRMEGELKNKHPLFVNDIERSAGVVAVSASSETFINSSSSTSDFQWEGKASDDRSLFFEANVDDQLIKTIGLKLISGRNFSRQIASDSALQNGAYLINETAAKKMGFGNDAIGKRVVLWGNEGKIIGVVADFNFQPLQSSIEPLILRYRPAERYSDLLVKVGGYNVKRTIDEIAQLYRTYEPLHPFTYGFIDQDLDALYELEQRSGRIIFIFSVLAIVVSCLGVFGLITFYTSLRIKEIGIRKLLGSSVMELVALLSASYIRLVLLAFVLAAPIAWLIAHEWLGQFAYRVNLEWWILPLVGCSALLLAFLTAASRCVAAALANPVKSLRSE